MVAGSSSRQAILAWQRTDHGFTLVELLLAVAIMGILAAMSYPAFRPERFQLDASLETVGSVLMGAQRLAVTRQYDVAVIFRIDSRTYAVHEDADNDGNLDASERVVTWPLEDGIEFGRGAAPAHSVGSAAITFAGRRDGDPVVVFHRSGAASEEGGVYLTASRRDPAVRAGLLTVDRATGRVTPVVYAGGAWKFER